MTVYQIAETLGVTAEQVRETLTPSELCEWGVYLNSPFSTRGRDVLMNGWLVHTIRSIVADKRRRPKFSESMFPFDKLSQEFFVKPKRFESAKEKSAAGKIRIANLGEVSHRSQVISKGYEKLLADYRAGKVKNRAGLYIHEQLRK